ncbi:hypothetical protein MWN41_00205 [Ornithobacterium rhinotracheale]|uniref:hypothetical protein n=1 Tax=Ornithobacterium rhinotracheale TaxID=28251 RepID=UPI001FF0F337|nr:hypothetical protein [Ornithobacterium rhinotracheale]MCK0201445.1 hypothetical protein [Ornithobacterium rhinotracheale]
MFESKFKNKSDREDLMTSSILGLLKYLPSDFFWYILRNACSCSNSSNLPEVMGEMRTITFWPKWSSKNTVNTTYIEPDIFIEFDKFDIIIEVKNSDDISNQKYEQWEKQIISYNNENKENSKDLIYIALGGNHGTLHNDNLDYQNKNYIINKCSWRNLFNEVNSILNGFKNFNHPIPNKETYILILEDIVRCFNFFGYYDIKWLKELKSIEIEYNNDWFRLNN